MKKSLLFAAATLTAGVVFAVSPQAARQDGIGRMFKFSADHMAVDGILKTATATGHVHAVSEPFHLRTDSATRDAEGVTHLADPTTATTCTNHPGICHWDLRGKLDYKDGKYIEGWNIWLHFYELPVFWFPYFYYPLEGECALRVMPGYISSWGAYVMTKYVYDIAGDPTHAADTWWLYGNTRFDLRYKNGIALGESLDWNLGDFGRGHFKVYYAWDENYDEYDVSPWDRHHRYYNWGSNVERDRYQIELEHTWDITERDILRLRGSITSDSYFNSDFMRQGFWTIANDWMGHEGNEIAWERNESLVGLGASVSGPLNKFYGGTARLPEVYLDLAPTPLFSLPVNYETENRIGYLTRQPAEYGNGDRRNPFTFNPGPWADYEAFRFDTYHRLTAPFKAADLVSVVPRLAYHGTLWSESGENDMTGWQDSSNAGAAFRSILEGGVTFAGRGKAWLSKTWQHTVEPYLDILAQQAWYDGIAGNNRPYVFDAIDASVNWEDQFAGRGRNLPYSYYGITPGIRNAFDRMDEHGRLRTIVDVDFYAALQFNHANWIGTDDCHKLAEVGDPNYGKHDIYAAPGMRVRWMPSENISLRAQAEYDPDANAIPLAQVSFTHAITKDFSYFVRYISRNYRIWDFSSTPYDHDYMSSDDLNKARFDEVYVGFTRHPIDWFAWSPFLRWDCHAGELDGVGSWFDYLTDCLGFRLILEYRNKFTRIDGTERDDDYHIGFFIYLRALGPGTGGLFGEN